MTNQLSIFEQKPQKGFYNSIPITGTELMNKRLKSIRQQDEILNLFKANKRLTPWQCEGMLNHAGKRWPITSIRRAITNLTDAGLLRKTGLTKVGIFGVKENVWEVI